MANNEEIQSLLRGLLDPKSSISEKSSQKSRSLVRARSDPLLKFVDFDDGNEEMPHEGSVITNLQPNMRTVVAFLVLYLFIGSSCFFFVRDDIKGKKTNGIIDSLYFCVVTMTTVGYGDLVPNTSLVKLLACASVFSGMAFVGLLLSKAANYLIEKQEVLLFEVLDKSGQYKIRTKMESNKVAFKFYLSIPILLTLMAVGILFLFFVEKLSLVNAFYCVCATVTTLGYGDISFSSAGGRIFASVWILACTLALGQFFFSLAEVLTEKKQRKLARWVLKRKMTVNDLEVADIDNSGHVGAAEFVLFKLREMGKISREDVSLLLHEFASLDVDQSGTLSPSDLILAQRS